MTNSTGGGRPPFPTSGWIQTDMENAFWVKQKYLKDVRSTIENISNNTCNTSIDH